jgi:hypothetical protein
MSAPPSRPQSPAPQPLAADEVLKNETTTIDRPRSPSFESPPQVNPAEPPQATIEPPLAADEVLRRETTVERPNSPGLELARDADSSWRQRACKNAPIHTLTAKPEALEEISVNINQPSHAVVTNLTNLWDAGYVRLLVSCIAWTYIRDH